MVLLKRADLKSDACDDLLTLLSRQESAELQRSHGRIEPRKRFKAGFSQPLLQKLPRSLLFIDEGGKSNPEPRLPGPRYFSVGAVAIGVRDAQKYVRAADAVKMRFFGKKDITFHEPGIRFHEGPYYFSGSTERQAEFDEALKALIEDTPFLVFGVGVRKNGFEQDFVDTGIDPYLPTDAYALAITMLMERYLDYLSTSRAKRIGRVTFESQGPLEDATHQLEFARLFIEGSQWVPDSAFRAWLETGCRFTPKQGSDPMELADIVSREIYEWLVTDCLGTPLYWDVVSQKIYCRGNGQMGKSGLKVFPDSDIRDRIEVHRALYCA